jgi:hypothetical protein
MGYACPVCEAPQQDAGHLANHLAFTAMLGDEDHEAWLDEHAHGWADQGERELANRVVEHAEETEFPQVFEDTTGDDGDQREPADERSGALFEDDGAHGHAHGPDHGHSHDSGHSPGHQHGHDLPTDIDPGQHAADPDDPETQEILEDAREMTREMLGVGEGDENEDTNDETSETREGDDTTDETVADDPGDRGGDE